MLQICAAVTRYGYGRHSAEPYRLETLIGPVLFVHTKIGFQLTSPSSVKEKAKEFAYVFQLAPLVVWTPLPILRAQCQTLHPHALPPFIHLSGLQPTIPPSPSFHYSRYGACIWRLHYCGHFRMFARE